MSENKKFKVSFYIDGFNLSYGFKKAGWKKYYWIDMLSLCKEFLRPDQELVRINHFTAVPKSPSAMKKHKAYFDANTALNKKIFKIHFGSHALADRVCRADCRKVYPNFEEKQTDVNLGITMISDFLKKQCDTSVLISADSDFLPVVRYIRENDPLHRIVVIYPPGNYSATLGKKATHLYYMKGYETRIKRCLMPKEVKAPDGKIIKIPNSWEADYPKPMSPLPPPVN